MAIISDSFTAIGAGASILLNKGESFDFSVAGTFVGTVVIEYSHTGGQTWVFVEEISAVDSGNIKAVTSAVKNARYSFRCSAFTSGTIVTTLSDVSDEFAEILNLKHLPLIKLFDDSVDINGNLFQLGAQSVFAAEDTIYIRKKADFPTPVGG